MFILYALMIRYLTRCYCSSPIVLVFAPVLVSAVSQNSSYRIVDGFRSWLFGSPQRIKVGWSLACRTPVLPESEVLRLIRVIIYMPQISHSEPKVEVPINNTRGFFGNQFWKSVYISISYDQNQRDYFVLEQRDIFRLYTGTFLFTTTTVPLYGYCGILSGSIRKLTHELPWPLQQYFSRP